MKKLLTLSLTLALLFTVGCNSQKSDEETTPNIEYSIYVGDGMLSSLTAEQTEANIDQSALSTAVKDLPQDCNFSFNPLKPAENSKATAQLNYKVAGKEYTFEYVSTAADESLTNSSIQSLNRPSTSDHYKTRIENRSVTLHLQSNTKELLFFSDLSVKDVDGDFTLKQAIEKAKSILTELYGAECIEYYGDSVSAKFVEEGEHNYISIEFRKKISGFNSSDCICININRKGELQSINAYHYAIFRSVADKLTAKQIQAGKTKLTDYLDQCTYRYETDSATLKINTEGECYLELYAVTTANNLLAFYVNVN